MKSILVRLEEETQEKLTRLARNEGKTTSDVLRELIRNYIRSRDMAAYIDDLWNRAGEKLKAGGVKRKDVSRIIRSVRASRK